MLIERVVIQGFKTFAKRTEFIFDPGVTAIVGPNGSGKSNIVDAIRWCLGEQSFSLLRSKKTSDVIFSGSDQKARLGMAQVSLTLDNSLGELPLDFAEIEITRRAYRDGDNEYLLNGQRVRLQDITDLLAQTGLGRRTYALIGQGLIDRVLSLAPEELRSLFEEAAGITGYQAKRATTLRRLEATEQNLTRVQDIVAELSPRLGYLRKQAERAREREQIAGDLRTLLRDWYGYHWHSALQQMEQHHAAVEALKAKVEAGQQAVAAAGKRVEQMRQQQAGLRGRLGELHRDSSRLHREAEQIGRELAVAQERMRQLQTRQEETNRDLAPLRRQQELLLERLAGLESGLVEAAAAYRSRQAAVDALQTELERRQQERRQLQDTAAAARRQVEQVQAARTETASRLRQVAERAAALDQERDQQTQAQSAAAAQAHELAEEVRRQEQALQAVEEQAAVTQEALATLEARREALRAELEQAQATRQAAERELDRLQTRHDLLQRLQQEGAGYASGVRAVLQAARPGAGGSPALQGILGTVASLVRVPPQLDKAIETALGGALQHVVAKRWQDAQAAIEYLKRSRGGRATFLPLDRLVVGSPLPAPTRSGILGNAAELVEYDAAIGDAVQQLLNRVWVAEDLSAARAALDALSGSLRPTVVTLEGDIIRPGGAVTGGSDPSRHDDSILARERELRALPAEISRRAAAVAQQVERCRSLARQIEESGLQLAPLQETLAQLGRQARGARDRLEEGRRRLDRARQTAHWHTERLAQLGEESTTLQQEEAALEARLKELTHQQAAAEAAEAQAASALEQAGDGDLLRRLADLRAAAAEAQGVWQSQQALLDSRQRELHATVEQITLKERQLSTLATEVSSLAARIAQLTQQEAELSRGIAALQQHIEPAERQLEQWSAEQAELESQERSLQESLRQDENAWAAAQLQFQRSEDQVRRLRHEIEQDLGLVLLEFAEDLAYQPPLPWDSVVEQLHPLAELPEGLEEEIHEMRARLARVNNVNPDAPREYAEAAGRHEYLLSQSRDLEAAIADLRKVIRELDQVMEGELRRTFAAVSAQFVEFFQRLFNGGTAKLVLADPEDITHSGIEIIARPPGKRPQSLALLSGGERTLTACALIFAILRVSPTPFCVLDEVDAALDEANVDRFRQTLEELSQGTQFILITHNRRTLEGTDAIYGVTMGADGASRVISLRLDGERILRRPGAEQEGKPAANGDDPEVAAIEELVKM
ncbi:MAG TPA: chromosome segregation protein SMC [Caldilineaceae bacterium]|nr:chromosome segregation protein SMC [Caldilineaceae bacterium]